MACLTNYAIQCVDVTTGQKGCFIFDTAHWQATGEFLAVSPVCADLDAFYKWDNANGNNRKACYLERITPPSAVIFENGTYVACAMADGSLIVQKKRTGKGYRLIGENAAVWADSIRTAIDDSEAALLCKALCTD